MVEGARLERVYSVLIESRVRIPSSPSLFVRFVYEIVTYIYMSRLHITKDTRGTLEVTYTNGNSESFEFTGEQYLRGELAMIIGE